MIVVDHIEASFRTNTVVSTLRVARERSSLVHNIGCVRTQGTKLLATFTVPVMFVEILRETVTPLSTMDSDALSKVDWHLRCDHGKSQLQVRASSFDNECQKRASET